MSITAIRNGIAATLTACGPYASREISACTFDVLESTNGGCAIVFLPDGVSQIEPLSYGTRNARDYHRKWRIGGTLYIRDTGDEQALWGKVWQGYDDLYNTFSKDDSLQSSACAAALVSVSQRVNTFTQAGGQLWKPVDFVLIAEEF